MRMLLILWYSPMMLFRELLSCASPGALEDWRPSPPAGAVFRMALVARIEEEGLWWGGAWWSRDCGRGLVVSGGGFS